MHRLQELSLSTVQRRANVHCSEDKALQQEVLFFSLPAVLGEPKQKPITLQDQNPQKTCFSLVLELWAAFLLASPTGVRCSQI